MARECKATAERQIPVAAEMPPRHDCPLATACGRRRPDETEKGIRPEADASVNA